MLGILMMATFFAILADLATVAAIIIGGVWTYKLFIQHREQYPAIRVEHLGNYETLSDSDALLRVELRVTNIGKTLAYLDSGFVRILRVTPCPPKILEWLRQDVGGNGTTQKLEAFWPMIEERSFSEAGMQLEPGEFESLFFDFFVPKEVKGFIVYSYVANAVRASERNGIGWNTKIFWRAETLSV